MSLQKQSRAQFLVQHATVLGFLLLILILKLIQTPIHRNILSISWLHIGLTNHTRNSSFVISPQLTKWALTQSLSELYTAQKNRFVIGNLIWQEHPEQAIQFWRQQLVSVDFLLQIATQQMKADGELALAIGLYRHNLLTKSKQLDPSRSEPLLFEALLVAREKDFSKSNELVQRANLLDNWENHLLALSIFRELGLIYEQQPAQERQVAILYQLAGEQGEQALTNQTNKSALSSRLLGDVYRRLGLRFQKEGNIDLADANFNASIRVQPENFWNYLSLVFVYQARHADPREIEALFDRAIEVAPTISWPYVKAADFYNNQHNEAGKAKYCELAPHSVRSSMEWRQVCGAPN